MSVDIVVAGAGIAGVATAYDLSVHRGAKVVLVDRRPPLSLTSDKSTECYRNWWPSLPMVQLMGRSIDLLDQMAAASANVFHLNRRGYLYVTADPRRLAEMETQAGAVAELGAGELRIHRGHDSGYPETADSGADLIGGPGLLHRIFPYLAETAVGALHVRRAGWLSAHQLGAWMLDRARDAGARLIGREVVGVDGRGGRVAGVDLDDGTRISAGALVNATGPMLRATGLLHGADLKVTSEIHHKLGFRDSNAAVPRTAPMLIWSDRQRLGWTEEESRLLAADDRGELAAELPAFCHGRPEGGPESPWVLALWEYHRRVIEPVWPLPTDPLYPEVVLRGMATMIPRLAGYLDHLPQPVVDGGYYTKTVDNRPLVGPAGIGGSFVCGALSGFGVMAAAAAGELASLHATGGPLPEYASAFHPNRFEDREYRELLETGFESGQL